jgi:nicotinamidase-related amidase
MPVTTLDQSTALLVIDLQNGVIAMPSAHSIDEVVARSVSLVDAFRAKGLPVVLVNVVGAPAGRTDQGAGGLRDLPDGWAELIPALNAQPDDIIVTKRARSAFANTGLTERLQESGVTQVVIVGVATSSGVESTARHAHEYGFNVTLAVDAMTDSVVEAHENSVTRIFPRLGETGTTQQILALLEGGGPLESGGAPESNAE